MVLRKAENLKKEKATTVTNYFLGSFREDLSIQNRDAWKEYLRQTNLNTVSPEIRREIERIKEIVDFSSYFRSSSSSAQRRRSKRAHGRQRCLVLYGNQDANRISKEASIASQVEGASDRRAGQRPGSQTCRLRRG